MEYDEFIEEVLDLDFMEDEEEADAAVKAVLGVLTSNMPEPQARTFAERLPDPLTLEKLRGQRKMTQISADQYLAVISDQFDIDDFQARTLIRVVLQVAREAVGNETFAELEEYMPSDWVEIMEEV